MNTDHNWMDLLKSEVENTDITKTAARLGYSRTTISLILSGKYPGKTDKVAKQVILILAKSIACPYSGMDILPDECRALSTRSVPTHNPQAMGQWRACQQCPNKMKKGEQS